MIGLGNIGTRVAKVAKAFEMDVMAWSPHLTKERARAAGVRLAASKRDLLFNSDVVSVHLQLSWSTRRIIDAGDIAAMRTNAYFVNTARAGLVDNDALVAALKQGRLAGAGLDVFDEEPLPATTRSGPCPTCWPCRTSATSPPPTTAPTSPRRSRTSRPGSPGSPSGSSAECPRAGPGRPASSRSEGVLAAVRALRPSRDPPSAAAAGLPPICHGPWAP